MNIARNFRAFTGTFPMEIKGLKKPGPPGSREARSFGAGGSIKRPPTPCQRNAGSFGAPRERRDTPVDGLRPAPGTGSAPEDLVNFRDEPGFRIGADELLDHGPVLEKQEGGNAPDF